jgi:hypothetical protein
VVFHTDMQVFVGLFAGQIKPEEAISGGLIHIEGDRIGDDRIEDDLSALSRFLNISGVPASA